MKLHTCENCGAEFDLDEHNNVCPFCGAEWTEEAIRDTKDYIEGLKREEDAVRQKPQQISHKTNRSLTYIIVGAVVIGLVAVLIAFVSTKLKTSSDDRKAKELLVELEEYADAGDYDSVVSVMDDTDYKITMRSAFDRYKDIQDMDYRLQQINRYIGYLADCYDYLNQDITRSEEDQQEWEEQIAPDAASWNQEMIRAYGYIRRIQAEAEKKQYPFENPQDYEYYVSLAETAMSDVMDLTDEDFATMYALYISEEDTTEMAEHMWEVYR